MHPSKLAFGMLDDVSTFNLLYIRTATHIRIFPANLGSNALIILQFVDRVLPFYDVDRKAKQESMRGGWRRQSAWRRREMCRGGWSTVVWYIQCSTLSRVQYGVLYSLLYAFFL